MSYSTADDTTSVPEIRTWSVIAHLPAETTSYTDNSRIAGERYKYAVVHKDLAYNYSVPLIGTEESVGTELYEGPSFKCFGIKGSVEFRDLENDTRITIFNIIGLKVYETSVNASSWSVPVSPGIYIVNVSGEVKKVIVN